MNKEERKEYMKQYRENNKEKIRLQKREYNEKNKDNVKMWQKNWRENNEEYCKEKEKKYREKNKDKINERQNIKVKCDLCGSTVLKRGLKRHQDTDKCKKHHLILFSDDD